MCTRSILLWAAFALISSVTSKSAFGGINADHYNFLESYKDSSANPCTDFYQYACGNWKTVHPNEKHTSSVDLVDSEVNKDFVHILKTRQQNLSKQPGFVRQALAYYESCKSVDNYSPEKFLRKLEAHEGLVWPHLGQVNKLTEEHGADGSNNANRYWFKMWATLRKYGLNQIFVSEYIYPKASNSNQNIIIIERPELHEEFVKIDRSSFDTLMEQMGIKDTLKVEPFWQIFDDFETKLLKLFDIEDKLDFEEVKLSEVDIPELRPYLEIVLNTTLIGENMQIDIEHRAYIRAVFNFLHDYDDEFLCRYLTVRFLWYLNELKPEAFANEEKCIAHVRVSLPLAMSWMYEQQHPELFSETAELERMFESLRAHFAQVLKTNRNNFNDEVLGFLTTKLKHMQLKVGNLPNDVTETTLEFFHRELALDEHDFYENVLKISHFFDGTQLAQLEGPSLYDAHNFGESSVTSFEEYHNQILVPLTLLHPPYYHSEFHDVFKYSLIGFFLAREMAHGFDKENLEYDARGNVRSHFGKLIKAHAKFAEHLKCLETPDVIADTVADVNGLRWAYETYFGNARATSDQLPWSKITLQQLFFRNYAFIFCGDVAMEDLAVNSAYISDRRRLQDSISQLEEFGRAYNCPVDATHRCQLW